MTETHATAGLGPLTGLVGSWKGAKGLDISPKPGGSEENPFHETIQFTEVGDAMNAQTQHLAVVRYLRVVRRNSDGEIFHDQTGYWMWDRKTGGVTQSLTIPRAVCLLAGGASHPAAPVDGQVHFKVYAKLEDPDWSILQSPFMKDNARTVAYNHELTLQGNQLRYSETTLLDIYGRTCEHTDENELTRS